MKISATNNQLLLKPTINSTNAERCGTPTLKDKSSILAFRDQMLAIDKNKIEKCGTPTLKDISKIAPFNDQVNLIQLNSNKVNSLLNKKVF